MYYVFTSSIFIVLQYTNIAPPLLISKKPTCLLSSGVTRQRVARGGFLYGITHPAQAGQKISYAPYFKKWLALWKTYFVAPKKVPLGAARFRLPSPVLRCCLLFY